MDIELRKVEKDKKDILYRLLEYSLFEESLNDGNEMNDEAIFEYKYFDRYFIDKNRYAFFVIEKDTNKLLGFVMINAYMQKLDSGHQISHKKILNEHFSRSIFTSLLSSKSFYSLIFE